MQGTVTGDIMGALYFLLFQAMGVMLSGKLLPKESGAVKLLLGSCIGSFALHWLPVLFAFFLKFSLAAHLLALLLMAAVCTAVLVLKRGPLELKPQIGGAEWKALFLILPVFACFAVMLFTHTIAPAADGSLYTGQCTYGDMNMHLSFLTSIARQQTFPPEYSLLPGTPLNYPFLADSISSSVYLFGASLRFAYILPALFAAAQVFFGFYVLMRRWLKDRAKSMLAWVLFFLNGGFGIMYFLDGLAADPQHFTRIFTSFYETPTNLPVEGNIRWVNVIADMMLPQRATLFGWAMLFAVLYLLYRAVFEEEKGYFAIAGVLAGGLPMIHTHSFLALGMICAGWLVAWAAAQLRKRADEPKAKQAYRRAFLWGSLVLGVLLLLGLVKNKLTGALTGDFWQEAVLSTVLIAGLGAFAAYAVCLLAAAVRSGMKWKELLSAWGLFLLIVLVLAVPQLLKWTFAGVSGQNFLRFHFNWGNQNDGYFWFYIKNIGIVALLVIPALIGMKRDFKVAAPALLIWFVAELVVFQPNVYDNNKLLYVAYALLCGICAGYMVELYRKLKGLGGRRLIAAAVLVACMVSGVLSIGRELVSSYQLYNPEQVAACRFIEEKLPADAVILTATNHNNAVASLTGRNIVCGTATFLYYHGLSYEEAQQDVEKMFESPKAHADLFRKHHVSYVYISSYERGSYAVDEWEIAEMGRAIYREGQITIYQIAEEYSG